MHRLSLGKTTTGRGSAGGRIPGRGRRPRTAFLPVVALFLAALCLPVFPAAAAGAGAGPVLAEFLDDISVPELVPGAVAPGRMRKDIPVIPALDSNGKVVGHIFLTTDFVATTGYSGKPIHIAAGINEKAVITGTRLLHHAEPIVLTGIPEARIRAVTDGYAGMDMARHARENGAGHRPDIVSGATVTLIVIDDSIIRASLKVARLLGLGGLEPATAPAGPRHVLKETPDPAARDWFPLEGDGSIRALRVDVGQINREFAATGDQRAISRPERGDPADTFIDLRMALASVPDIGYSLLGPAEYGNLGNWLAKGDHALLVAGRGRYSFKGSGYVRGGIFDRIQLIQGDTTIRFHDRQHRRLGHLAPDDAPAFTELDLFRIPAESGFDPTLPFRLQLLVQRAVGPLDKVYVSLDLGYRTPDTYLAPSPAPESAGRNRPGTGPEATDPGQLEHLWKRIWTNKQYEAAALLLAILVLTGVFFFQTQLARHERLTSWFRTGFLVFTLAGIGWYADAQLSIVNLLTLLPALTSGFSWSAFLMDPLLFILWSSVAASLLFWGRGVFCGWLCPFGALQELLNRLARLARIPQIAIPWGLHERLWPIKYIIFLALLGLSLYSLELATHYAEIEPFKTAIILKFQRDWPYVALAVIFLAAGLFVERFYCRYLCPLGAALAIPARLRMFDWLKRYRECGAPCQRCAHECMVQAIHPEGNINPNECLQCLHCQVLYQSETGCPVRVARAERRRKRAGTHPSPTRQHTA